MKKRYVMVFLIVLLMQSGSIWADPSYYSRTSREGLEELYRKYNSPIIQEKLNAEIDEVKLLLYTDYREWILEQSQGSVNFGGEFIIIEWGCGTECQTGVMVDMTTGEIITLPTSEWGKEYRKDSMLLVVNPPSGRVEENRRPEYAYPAYYLWDGKAFILLHDTREKENP